MADREITRTIIPAEPGWACAWHWAEDGKEGVTLQPIIAWEIEREEMDYHPSVKAKRGERCAWINVNPITTSGLEENAPLYRRPDGLYEHFDQTAMSEEEARKFAREQREADAEATAKRTEKVGV